MVRVTAKLCADGELDRGTDRLFKWPLGEGVRARVLGCVLWKEGRNTYET